MHLILVTILSLRHLRDGGSDVVLRVEATFQLEILTQQLFYFHKEHVNFTFRVQNIGE